MPAPRGTIYKAPGGWWGVLDGTDKLLSFTEYMNTTSTRYSSSEQTQVIRDMNSALISMEVVDVTGTSPETWQFRIGDYPAADELDYGAGLQGQFVNVKDLIEASRDRMNKGTIPIVGFGDLEEWKRELGWPPGDEAFMVRERIWDRTKGPREKDWMGEPTGEPTGEYVLTEPRFDSAAHTRFINQIKDELGLAEDVAIETPMADGSVVTYYQGKKTVTTAEDIARQARATGQWSIRTVQDDQGKDVFNVITDPDGNVTREKIDSVNSHGLLSKVATAGGDVGPRVRDNQRQAAQQQPVRRQVSDEIIENVVPGYHAVQVKPGEWELVKAPSPAEGPTPGELEYGKPFPIGDGRFAIKTGEDDYEIVTPAGGPRPGASWWQGLGRDS